MVSVFQASYLRYLRSFVCSFWGLSRSPSAILSRYITWLPSLFPSINHIGHRFPLSRFLIFLIHIPISRPETATRLLFFCQRTMLHLSYSCYLLHLSYSCYFLHLLSLRLWLARQHRVDNNTNMFTDKVCQQTKSIILGMLVWMPLYICCIYCILSTK